MASVVVVEMMLPLASVTVVVVEPFALVVTVVVSVDEELLELDPELLALVLAPALLLEALLPDPDRIEDATEALDEPMDMLMDKVPDC